MSDSTGQPAEEPPAPQARRGNEPPRVQAQASPWSLREKLGRIAWMYIGSWLFWFSFHNWYAYRAMILRAFGAKIGRGARVRATVHVEIPWHLRLGEDVTVGDHAILYALGPITLGDRTIISQHAHLCAGTHDHTARDFRLLRPPIEVGSDVWIAAEAFVGPDVSIGDRSVVGARSVVMRNLPPDMICAGHPARPLKPRVIR